MKAQHSATLAKHRWPVHPILPMITLLREFLIVRVPQVDNSLYQIKRCLSLVLYRKYSTQRVVSRRNIVLVFASCYICLSPTLFVLYFPYSTHGSALSNTHIYIYIYPLKRSMQLHGVLVSPLVTTYVL